MRRRVGCFLVAIVALIIVAFIIVNHVGGDWGPRGDRPGADEGPPGPDWWPPVTLLLIGIAIFVIVRKMRRIFEPLAQMMDATGRVADGDYSVRLDSAGPPDVQGVIRSFNTMTERLASNEEQRKRLLSDIAHELRTPLAVVQGTVEGMLDDVYPRDDGHLAPLLDQTRIIARLLDDLQTMATAEAGMLALHRIATDIGDLLRDVAASFAPLARGRGIGIAVDGAAAVVIRVDPVRIRQVLDNLVTNAIRYTPEAGVITLSAQASPRDVTIEVRDTGRGMPAEDAERMFERFVKSSDSGGSGLGLAIARGLVEAHGGAITATSSPGAGTTVTIRLPHQPT